MPLNHIVALARAHRADYGLLPHAEPAPELPEGRVQTVAGKAIRDLFHVWGLDGARAGSADWNPLGAVIPEGAKIVLKPNWVLHANQIGYGLECLVTHTTLIEAALEYALLARPSRVVLGDAPVQGCDFTALTGATGVGRMIERFASRGVAVELCDFRRTVLPGGKLGGRRLEDRRPAEQFTLFDLGRDSLLEGLPAGAQYRVTSYNPDLLATTHGAGRHRYLIARDVIDADVVINLPKLKCHKKACITGALKNLVGINGNKEYLPHHRKGGPAEGGDCYGDESWWKRRAEDLFDAANRARPGVAQRGLAWSAQQALRCSGDDNLEGSWYGNDTVWRMSLDLQRILLYGRNDGSLAAEPQRRIVTITDAIIAGEGEGPLAPSPVAAGLVTGALNPAAAEWVHARLMGFDPARIPIVREAFGDFPHRLAAFGPAQLRVRTAAGERSASDTRPAVKGGFRPPRGWKGHCELEEGTRGDDRGVCQQSVVA